MSDTERYEYVPRTPRQRTRVHHSTRQDLLDELHEQEIEEALEEFYTDEHIERTNTDS